MIVSVVKEEEIDKEEEIGIEQGSKVVLRSIIEESSERLWTRTNTPAEFDASIHMRRDSKTESIRRFCCRCCCPYLVVEL